MATVYSIRKRLNLLSALDQVLSLVLCYASDFQVTEMRMTATPKFDLYPFEQSYFDDMHSRAIDLRKSGIF